MTADVLIILLVIGATAGFLAGFFGIGGGIIIVPSLIAFYGYTGYHSNYLVHTVIATSLFTVIFTTISSGYKHTKHNNVIWKAALIIGIVSSIVVFFLSKIAISVPGDSLKIIFSFLLIIVALKMLFEKKKELQLKTTEDFNAWICGGIGVISGAISAFSGLAGGIFVIPLMRYVLKFPIKKAIGTSSAAIFLTAVSGVLGYIINKPADFSGGKYFLGLVDTASALPIIIASIPMSQIGVLIHQRTNSSLLAKLFALLMLLIAVRMIFF